MITCANGICIPLAGIALHLDTRTIYVAYMKFEMNMWESGISDSISKGNVPRRRPNMSNATRRDNEKRRIHVRENKRKMIL